MALALRTSRAQTRKFFAPQTLNVISVWRQRRALAHLSPAMLRDIGVSPEEAAAEAARPFWDLPR